MKKYLDLKINAKKIQTQSGTLEEKASNMLSFFRHTSASNKRKKKDRFEIFGKRALKEL